MAEEAPSAKSEVKGLWFVTARRYLLQEHGDRALHSLLAEMREENRPVLSHPLASAWYPEEAMQDAFRVSRDILARGDRNRMLDIFEQCTHLGINHFWRVALRVASTEFALRSLPATWRHVRRGPGRMEVSVSEKTASVHYSSFPYFDDLNYRLLVLGTLRPLLACSTGAEPRVEIVDHGSDWLTASVKFP